MRLLGVAVGIVVAVAAAGVILFVFADETDAPHEPLLGATPTATIVVPTPTPLPATWLDGVEHVYGDAKPELLSCLDRNGDGRLNGADGIGLDVDVPLDPAGSCVDPDRHADFYAGGPSDPAAFACEGDARPLLIVAVASAGSDLHDPTEGESLGLIDIVNRLQARSSEAGIATQLIVTAPAIFGAAELPQTSMERWIAAELRARLSAAPCLRAVMIGHSHGGSTVTSVLAALDAAYGARMLGVLIDRTVVLYDRPAAEIPASAQLLNFFQTNEGWHGERIDAPNVVNFDESGEVAPVAPSDGGGGAAVVTHKTLDDSIGVQMRVAEAVMAWASR